MLQFYVFLIVLAVTVMGQETLSSSDTENKLQSPVILICSSQSLAGPVSFTNNEGKVAGGCSAGGSSNCGSAFNYTLTQDNVNMKTYLEIPICAPSLRGIWKCSQTTTASFELKCLEIPNSENVTLVGLNKDEEIRDDSKQVAVSCSSGCAYPGVKFKFEYLNPKSHSVLQTHYLDAETNDSSTCTNPGGMTYTSKALIINQANVETTEPFKVKCTVMVTSATRTFPSVLSNFTITVCDMLWIFLSFIFLGLMMVSVAVGTILHIKKPGMIKVYTPEGDMAEKVWKHLVFLGIAIPTILCMALTVGLSFVVCQRSHAIRDGVLIGIFTMIVPFVVLLVNFCSCLQPGGHGKGDDVQIQSGKGEDMIVPKRLGKGEDMIPGGIKPKSSDPEGQDNLQPLCFVHRRPLMSTNPDGKKKNLPPIATVAEKPDKSETDKTNELTENNTPRKKKKKDKQADDEERKKTKKKNKKRPLPERKPEIEIRYPLPPIPGNQQHL